MAFHRNALAAATLASTILTASLIARAQTDVLTWHNDQARTGQNLTETLLTPEDVNAKTFGLLANVKVDGKVDAQPLYVSTLTLPAGTHNILYIATEHDSVYAIDADTGKLYWQKTMLAAGETTSDDRNCGQVVPEIGITATPVIDRTAGPHGTLYLVAMSKSPSAGTYFQRIHALDLTTGAEQFNGPIVVKATYPGAGAGSADGLVTFDPKQYKERPALLLLNGTLYTSWGSHCDIKPYAGWMMTYDEKTLAQTSVLDFVPNGSDAAPWNAGAGPAADATGNVYISLGNGTLDTTLTAQGFPSQADYGNSLLKLALKNNKLSVLDYWSMYNSNNESNGDTDLGSGGYMLLPDLVDASGKTRHLSVAAGKDHNLYVVDRDNMGHYDPTTDATIYQQLTGGLPGGAWSSPAYFNNHVYYGPVGGALRSFEITAAKLNTSPTQSPTTFGYPGTTPSVSANGLTNAILWATENSNPAVLHAYDANNLNTELYNSTQAANSRDSFGTGNKFIVPTIANGKVYVATTNSVALFGFVRQTPAPLPDGPYMLVNQNSHLAMDDPHASTSPGVAIWQYAASGVLRQRWFFSYNGNGFYTIQNASSKLYLTDAGSSTTPGTLLTQALATNADNELWSLTKSGTGWLITSKSSKLAIDDLNRTTKAGPNLGLTKPSTTSDQVWTLE